MKQEIYDKHGVCKKCKGTNKCSNCKGDGVILSKSGFLKGKEVPCPVCYGGGGCKSCNGIKLQGWMF